MEKHDRQTLRLTLPKDLVLECQRTLEQQGIPLNVTQAVKSLLIVGLKTRRAASTAGDVSDEQACAR
jgi:uncharacterized metal-binding protein YceD (DUF177 family)